MKRCYYCMEEIESGIMTCPHCGGKVDQYPDDPRYLKPGVMLQGKYMVGTVLGAGGFGITYVGWDTTLERKIAIKEYYPRQYSRRDDDGNTVTAGAMNATDRFKAGLDRFLQEAKSLRELHGVEGVVAVDNFFRENGTGYIVMEFLEGEDVRTILKNSTERVDYEWCRRIILTILDTLSKIHEKDILHRDIAPDNVLITKEGIIKLIDFGAAKHEEGIEVEDTESLVKAGYSPLEQYTSVAPQGPYTDLYATAALMYFMLTGVKPPSAIDRRDGAGIEAPSDMGIDIPENAEMGMMMCLNIMPEHRLESAKQFMETLDGKDFTPDYEPQWNLIPEKKKGLKRLGIKAKVGIVVAVLLVLVTGGVVLSQMGIGEEFFSPGGVGRHDRIPVGIKGADLDSAIKQLRDKGITNRVIIKYDEYEPAEDDTEATDTVKMITPDEQKEIDDDKDIILSVLSNHVLRKNALNGLDFYEAQERIQNQNVKLTDVYINDDSKYNGVLGLTGAIPENFSGDENIEIDDTESLIDLFSGRETKIHYSIGKEDDYSIRKSEIDTGYSGISKGNAKEKIVERILDVLSKKENMKASESFENDRKDWLKKMVKEGLDVKSEEEYSDSVGKGKIVRVDCDESINVNPISDKKEILTVVFSKGAKPKPKVTHKDNSGGSSGGNQGDSGGGDTLWW